MLLVVLGAGASYDSAPARHPLDPHYRNMPFRPPLAAELFSNRDSFVLVMDKYPQCRPIIPRLQRPPADGSVERELQRLQAEASNDPERHQQLSAVRYYLQQMMWECTSNWNNEVHGITNQKTLVDDIRHWKKPGEKVCFVTFNYDMMLEDAFGGIGIQFNELSSYISSKDFLLIKLHGSINWAREVRTYRPDIARLDRRSIAQALIRPTADIHISKNYTLIGEYPPAARNNLPLFPALAIPVETKLDFECPEEHVNALKEFLPQVSKILTVGWRGTELPFLELLEKDLRGELPILVVAGGKKDAVASIENMRKAGVRGQYDLTDSGFTDFIVSRKGIEFLKP